MIEDLDLRNLADHLDALAAECIAIGTPFHVRRDIKAARRKLTLIQSARDVERKGS